ncbi:hypothetical protein HIM_04839 [Hirsutella minnesotensis 3608]|uniref:glycogenin glucosyltransferase n=1 Tax=Hirsutella minnesotensis 3608 TaxID=1043627 RepID=A0A0F8A0X5_9HYPO|nr:hypothetical protein HIM_04839 [Hirsutella minnesotensis 3608]
MDGEQVYATLLLSDSYLPGALVLAHSLRDAGATRKLAVLVTTDSVSADTITQLQAVYDHILAVPRIRNDNPANLYLMNRADLHSAFTKINLWKQVQFSRIVYIDADVVAYRAPDELFDLSHAFAAAPDTGWPDLFNTGVMALTPNMGDFYAMLAMAERGISMDGADQGLINMHFGQSFHRLPFTYNVTPSAHYQYVPAYRHFQSSINMVHFIGANKPWLAGRNAPHGSSPYDEMVGRWWAVHDRHLKLKEPSRHHAHVSQPRPTSSQGKEPRIEYFPSDSHGREAQDRHPSHAVDHGREDAAPPSAEAPFTLATADTHTHGAVQHQEPASSRPEQEEQDNFSTEHVARSQEPHTPPPVTQPGPPPLPTNTWDAQRQPPPVDSKPEAINFPSTHYEMSQDTKPFVPPVRYPSPPRNMWYQIPNEPPAPAAETPPPIFPWEKKQPKPSRIFTSEEPKPLGVGLAPSVLPQSEQDNDEGSRAPTEPCDTEPSSGASKSEPQTPLTPSIKIIPSDPWTSFPRLNAWDEVPEIDRYVEGLQRHRRAKSQGAASGTRKGPGPSREDVKPRVLRLTDFPSAVDRPSLPVTPAPVHRLSYWEADNPEPGHEGTIPQPLPTAEGVPAQTEWVCVHGRRWKVTDCPCNLADAGFQLKDPAEQLQKLARQQSEALLRKLAGENEAFSGLAIREIPSRPLPFGSDSVRPPGATSILSPTPVSNAPGVAQILTGSDRPLATAGTATVTQDLTAETRKAEAPGAV